MANSPQSKTMILVENWLPWRALTHQEVIITKIVSPPIIRKPFWAKTWASLQAALETSQLMKKRVNCQLNAVITMSKKLSVAHNLVFRRFSKSKIQTNLLLQSSLSKSSFLHLKLCSSVLPSFRESLTLKGRILLMMWMIVLINSSKEETYCRQVVHINIL